MAFDKFGFPQGIRTPAMLQDIENATQSVQNLKDQWTKDGFNTAQIEEFSNSFIGDEVRKNLMSRVAAADSPNKRAEGRTELEGEAIHLITAGQAQLQSMMMEKIPLAKPEDSVGSAIKGMQITLDNMTQKMNIALQSMGNYADASMNPPMNLDAMIKDTASINAKYMKTIFNKMNEFTNKKLNAELASTVAKMPASKRSMFADMKQVINQDILKQYSGIGNGIGGMLSGILSKTLKPNDLIEQAISMVNNPLTPTSNTFFRNWIPGMSVTQGEKIRFRNNVFTVGRTGRTGTTLPTIDTASQSNGNTTLTFDSFATGNSVDGDETLYGDVKTHPTVPICYAEDIMGQAISGSKDAIVEANSNVIKSMNAFLDDMKIELEDAEQAAKPKARDASLDGAVLGITDEEGLGNNQGGSFYITDENVATINAGNVTNRGVGIASTAPGGGVGLTVDITVTEGGATGTTVGELHIKLLTGGSGYETPSPVNDPDGTVSNANTTGGSGSDCKASITFESGVVNKITITEGQGGTGYKKGDVLTVTGGGGSGCTFEIIKPRGRIDQFGLVLRDRGTGYSTGDLITVFRETYNSTAPDATFTATQTTDPGQVRMDAPTSGKNKPQGLGGIMSLLGGLGGDLSAALDFKNITANVFPFELPPNPAVADFYTLKQGGGGMPDSQNFSLASLADNAIDKVLPDDLNIPDKLPFALPTKGMPDISNIASSLTDAAENLSDNIQSYT